MKLLRLLGSALEFRNYWILGYIIERLLRFHITILSIFTWICFIILFVTFEDDIIGHREQVLLIIDQILRSLAKLTLRNTHQLRRLGHTLGKRERDCLLVVAWRWQTALTKLIIDIAFQLLTHGSVIVVSFTTFSMWEGIYWTLLTFWIRSRRRFISFVLLTEGLALLQSWIAFRRFQLLSSNIFDLSEVEHWNNTATWLHDFGFLLGIFFSNDLLIDIFILFHDVRISWQAF
jgi:hypothetical protein